MFRQKYHRGKSVKGLVFLASISAGLIISSGFGQGEERHVPWLGLPSEQVSQLTFSARQDSRKLSGGGYLLEAELIKVSSVSGAETDAGGRLICFFEKDPAVYRGEIIEAKAGLRVSPLLAGIWDSQDLGDHSLMKEVPSLTAYLKAEELLRIGRKSAVWGLREALSRNIEHRCYAMGEDSGGLLLALLTGNREGLSVWETQIFREAGCSHILALSGMHLGILSTVILLILRPLPGRKPAFIISSLIVFGYLILTGFGISLVRAALMYFLFGLSNAFYRKTSAVDILLLSFVLLTAAAPSTFYTLSFRLSFLAVAGILTAAPEINEFLKPWLPPVLRLPLACSAGAQLLVIPILLSTFGIIYPVGLIAGIVIAPLVTLFMWTGMFFLFTGFKAVSIFSDLIYKAICRTAETASSAPSVSFHESALWLVPLLAGLIILLITYSIRRRQLNGISGKL